MYQTESKTMYYIWKIHATDYSWKDCLQERVTGQQHKALHWASKIQKAVERDTKNCMAGFYFNRSNNNFSGPKVTYELQHTSYNTQHKWTHWKRVTSFFLSSMGNQKIWVWVPYIHTLIHLRHLLQDHSRPQLPPREINPIYNRCPQAAVECSPWTTAATSSKSRHSRWELNLHTSSSSLLCSINFDYMETNGF